jgi:hypothetical protein
MSTNANTTFSADDEEVARQIAQQVLSEAGFATGRELPRTPVQGERRSRLAVSLTPPSVLHRPSVTTATGPSSLPTLPTIPEGGEEQKGEKSKPSTGAARVDEGEGGQYSYAPPPKAPVSLAKVFEQAMAGVFGSQGIEPSTSSAAEVWEAANRRTPMTKTTQVSFVPPATSAFRPISTISTGAGAAAVPPSPPTVTVYPPLGGAYAQGLATLLGNGPSGHTAPPISTVYHPPSQAYVQGGHYGPPTTSATAFTHTVPPPHSSYFPPPQGYPAQFPPPPTAPYYPPSSYHAPNPPPYYQSHQQYPYPHAPPPPPQPQQQHQYYQAPPPQQQQQQYHHAPPPPHQQPHLHAPSQAQPQPFQSGIPPHQPPPPPPATPQVPADRNERVDKVKIPILTSKEPQHWLLWRRLAERACRTNKYNDERAISEIMCSISGDAQSAIDHLPAENVSLQEYLDSIQRLLVHDSNSDLARAEFHQAKQDSSESLLQWHSRLRGLWRHAFPYMWGSMNFNRELIDRFCHHLNDAELSKLVSLSRPRTYDEASQSAQSCLASLLINRQNFGTRAAQPRIMTITSTSSSNGANGMTFKKSSNDNSVVVGSSKSSCSYCGFDNHNFEQCLNFKRDREWRLKRKSERQPKRLQQSKERNDKKSTRGAKSARGRGGRSNTSSRGGGGRNARGNVATINAGTEEAKDDGGDGEEFEDNPFISFAENNEKN